MARRTPGKFGSSSTQRSDEFNKKYNLAYGMAEKLGVSERIDEQWEVVIPKDVEDAGTQLLTAPTTNPTRPRALSIGYNVNSKKLIIIFRDNSWWEYRNVPVEMWMNLKSTKSTGRFLRDSGLDSWLDMGQSDPSQMSEASREQFTYSAVKAGRMQKGINLE